MAEIVTAIGCTVAAWNWGEKALAGVPACGEPPAAVLTFTCSHEHIDGALACAACAAELRRVAGILICPRCEDGPQSHECPVAMTIRWLGSEESGAPPGEDGR